MMCKKKIFQLFISLFILSFMIGSNTRAKNIINCTVGSYAITPDGNMHDYMTIAHHFRPNPETDYGYYTRKDGEVNPEARDNFTDFKEKERFFDAVNIQRLLNHFRI